MEPAEAKRLVAELRADLEADFAATSDAGRSADTWAKLFDQLGRTETWLDDLEGNR